MNLVKIALPASALVALSACKLLGNLPELTLGADQNIPPIEGSAVVDVPPDFTCGQDIADPEGTYTITTSGTQESCQILFAQDVLVLAAEEYAQRPELEGAQMVKRIEFEVSAFSLTDGVDGPAIAPDALEGRAFDTAILTLADLQEAPPFTKVIEGAPIEGLKEIVAAEDDLIIPVDVSMTVNLTPAPPAQIALTFDAQPNLVFGF